MLKKIFILLGLGCIMQAWAMEEEPSIVPHFPRDVWKKIAHYMVALHHALDYESDDQLKRRASFLQLINLPQKYAQCVSPSNLYCLNVTNRIPFLKYPITYPGYFCAESPDRSKCAIWGPLTEKKKDAFKLLVLDPKTKKEIIDVSFNDREWDYSSRLRWFETHKIALATSGIVMGVLEHTRDVNSEVWDLAINIINLQNTEQIQKICYQSAHDPLSIDFNLQGTQIIINTKGGPVIYPLNEDVRKLSMIKDEAIKMLILQRFFDQQN